MFVVLSYDVAAKRDAKVMKICRKYLCHELRSVFEGVLTERELRTLKTELTKVLDVREDKVNIYECTALKYSVKESFGNVDEKKNIL